jgi:hypothetical protein
MKSRADHLLTIAASVLSVLMISWSSSPSGVVDLSQTQQTPIVITQPGSYQLVSTLTSSGPEDDVIHIDTDNVTIDLNGFTIFPGLHAGGITSSQFPGHSNLVIKNGSITGGFESISAGANSTIRDVNLAGAARLWRQL